MIKTVLIKMRIWPDFLKSALALKQVNNNKAEAIRRNSEGQEAANKEHENETGVLSPLDK